MQGINLSSETIDHLCDTLPSFLKAAREIGAAETKQNWIGNSLEEFVTSFGDYWTGLGYCELAIKTANQDEVVLEMHRGQVNRQFLLQYIEGAISEAMGDYFFIKSMTKTGEVRLIKSTDKLSFRKEPILNTGTKYKNLFGNGITSSPDVSYMVFSDLVRHGHTGLVITRRDPVKVREKYHLKYTDIFQLTDLEGECRYDPTRLEFEISRSVNSLFSKEKESVMLLDGMEYLCLYNGFEKTFKSVMKFKDQAIGSNSLFLLPVDKKALSEKEYFSVVREFFLFEPKSK